jgi:hypothetical protein
MKDHRKYYIIYLFFVLSCSINKKYPMNNNESILANNLLEIGYSRLFQFADGSLVDSIWNNGKNYHYLLNIVLNKQYDDYARLLASEILFAKQKDFTTKDQEDTLAYIYSKALIITGDTSTTFRLSGNLWGFMYFSDKDGISDFGILGTHLMTTKKKVTCYLIELLVNSNILVYEGSEEATIGNSLKYRVKDAAAYYIGKISNIPVKYYENFSDRDLEIERLKEKLKQNGKS